MTTKLAMLAPGARVETQLEQAIVRELPGATVRVASQRPGHFRLDVASELFRGKSRLECQRLVYRAIAPLMKGERAPVHAIDHLETKTV